MGSGEQVGRWQGQGVGSGFSADEEGSGEQEAARMKLNIWSHNCFWSECNRRSTEGEETQRWWHLMTAQNIKPPKKNLWWHFALHFQGTIINIALCCPRPLSVSIAILWSPSLTTEQSVSTMVNNSILYICQASIHVALAMAQPHQLEQHFPMY